MPRHHLQFGVPLNRPGGTATATATHFAHLVGEGDAVFVEGEGSCHNAMLQFGLEVERRQARSRLRVAVLADGSGEL